MLRGDHFEPFTLWCPPPPPRPTPCPTFGSRHLSPEGGGGGAPKGGSDDANLFFEHPSVYIPMYTLVCTHGWTHRCVQRGTYAGAFTPVHAPMCIQLDTPTCVPTSPLLLRTPTRPLLSGGGGGSGRVPTEEPCGWRWVLLSCPWGGAPSYSADRHVGVDPTEIPSPGQGVTPSPRPLSKGLTPTPTPHPQPHAQRPLLLRCPAGLILACHDPTLESRSRAGGPHTVHESVG